MNTCYIHQKLYFLNKLPLNKQFYENKIFRTNSYRKVTGTHFANFSNTLVKIRKTISLSVEST